MHACRPICAGDEITVNYGFDDGCVRREARQRYLSETFGFVCKCAKCELRGDALRASEDRLSQIGDTSSLAAELSEWGALANVVCEEAEAVLGRLERRALLLRQEHRGGIPVESPESYQAFVEFCEGASSILSAIVGAAPASSPEADAEEATLSFGQRSAPLSSLPPKAAAYMAAAHRWAIAAKEVTRTLKGEDHLAYQLWQRALQEGWWHEGTRAHHEVRAAGHDGRAGARAEDAGADGQHLARVLALYRRLPGRFFQHWIDAGLGPPPGGM